MYICAQLTNLYNYCHHTVADCDPPCSPEGQCIEPNVCACPEGLNGNQCQHGEF